MTFLRNLLRPGVYALALASLLVACANATPKPPTQLNEQNHGFTSEQRANYQWWNIPYPTSFDTSTLKPQSFIKVDGNRLVDEQGKTVILRGINTADIDKLARDGQWQESLFAELKDWGVNVIRLPIHPLAYRMRGKDWYFERMDEAVRWANQRDIYLIIDWHSIGNLEAELFQHPMYATTKKETTKFWRDVALRYKNVPTMAVYELFNEPTHNYMGVGDYSLGKISWEQWRNTLEDIIDLIYLYDNTVIPLVTGFNWGYDLTPVAEQPIRREGIAYAAHPYPQKAKPEVKSKANFYKMWDETWGYVADKYPIIASELGWVREDGYGAHVPVIHNEGTYGPMITEYMEENGISYTVWVFDPDWSPTMINDWDFTPSEQGAFFKKEFQRRNR